MVQAFVLSAGAPGPIAPTLMGGISSFVPSSVKHRPFHSQRLKSPPGGPLFLPVALFGPFDAAAARYAVWAQDIFSSTRQASPPSSVPEQPRRTTTTTPSSPLPPTDFETMTSPSMRANIRDSTICEIPVLSVLPVTAAHDLFQISFDVSATQLSSRHVAPGQFVQLAANVGPETRRGLFTIASPPGEQRESFQVLVHPDADPLGLCLLHVGDVVRMGPVAGTGLDYTTLISGKNIYALADCAQGFAAIVSLLEWDTFKAATGSGANRTTLTTIYYPLLGPESIPFPERLSTWALYGISLVPLSQKEKGCYAKEFEGLNVDMNTVHTDNAVFCVADATTAEQLFTPFQAKGALRTRFQVFCQQRIDREAIMYHRHADEWKTRTATDRSPNVQKSDISESGESRVSNQSSGADVHDRDLIDDVRRQPIEDQVWEKWVAVRNQLRSQFENSWREDMTSRIGVEAAAAESAKQQAWETWFASNKDAWRLEDWDEVKWDGYWSTWEEEQSKWSSKWRTTYSETSWWWGGSGSQGRRASWREAQWGKQDYYSSGGDYYYNDTSSSNGESSQYSGQDGGWRSSSSRGGSDGNTMIDFYKVLDVSSHASIDEIKIAYRKKAMKLHPDLHPELGRLGIVRMQEVIVAYMTLKDPRKRAQYDRFGA